MRFKLLLPTRTVLDIDNVDEVIVEAENGSLGLLPHHIDFTAALVPGILSCTAGGREYFAAVDEGILTKAGTTVTVAVRRAVTGSGLGTLRETVAKVLLPLPESDQKARSALARLEAGFIRRLIELKKQ